MLKIQIIILFTITIVSGCCSEDQTDCRGWGPGFNLGWAGTLEELNRKPFDYYYKKVYGEVNIDKKMKSVDSLHIQTVALIRLQKMAKLI